MYTIHFHYNEFEWGNRKIIEYSCYWFRRHKIIIDVLIATKIQRISNPTIISFPQCNFNQKAGNKCTCGCYLLCYQNFWTIVIRHISFTCTRKAYVENTNHLLIIFFIEIRCDTWWLNFLSKKHEQKEIKAMIVWVVAWFLQHRIRIIQMVQYDTLQAVKL